jgi:hypothetical protein
MYQSMHYFSGLSDGTATLEEGTLTSVGVVAESIQTDNINIKNNTSSGQTSAIGRDVAVGNSLVVPNFYTSKIVSDIFESKIIKTDKLKLSHNLQTYDENDVGHIKRAPEIVSLPLLKTNTNITVTYLALPIGVYIINYTFDLGLNAISLPAFHAISHGLSSDNINANILLKQEYRSLDFANDLSFVTINETVFHHVTEFNSFIYVLATHNTFTNNISSVILQNVNISAVRIA